MKETDSFLSAILSTTKTAIFWKDRNRRFLGVNKAFLDYYGFANESVLLGKTDEDMGWHPDPGPYETDEERVLEEGISTYRVPGKCFARGELRDIVASKAPLIVEGEIVGLVGSFDDVTKERRQDEEIAKLNRDLEKRVADHDQLMNISDISIITISLPDYTVKEYNNAACELIGYTREGISGRFHSRLAEYFTGPYRKNFELFQAVVEEAEKAKKPSFSVTLRIPSAKGALWVSGACSFSETPAEKEPSSIIVIYRDITDIILSKSKLEAAEKEARKVSEIEERNAQLNQMIDGVPSGLGALRISHGVPSANLQLNRYFAERVDLKGFEKDGEIKSERFPLCLFPKDRSAFKRAFYKLLESKKDLAGQYRIRAKDGQHYYWVNVEGSISQIGNDEEVAYFVFTDITETKKAEADLLKSQRFYKEAVRAAQLTTWIYDLTTHEIIMNEDPSKESYQWTKEKHLKNIPESILDQIQEENWPAVKAMYDQVNQGHDASCEFWFKQQNGREPRCERIVYIIQKDEKGRPARAIGLGKIITAEKKAEERYEREVGYLRDIDDNTLIAKGHYNLTKDLVLEYTTKNDLFFKAKPGSAYSVAVEAFAGLSYQEEERKQIADKLDRANLLKRFRSGQTSDSLMYRRRINGQLPIWISMNIRSYVMPETGDVELFSYAYDVSDRMENEELMSLISGTDFDYLGFIFADTKQFEFVKKSDKIAFPEVRVITPYEECCQYVRKNFVNEEERNQFDSAVSLENILAGLAKNQRHVTTYRRNEKGKVSCKQLSYVWFDEAAKIILTVRSDVTAAYERDQEQVAAIEKAKFEADKANEAKSAFLSSMSHDIRTPLNGVIGFTELALKEEDPSKKKDYLEKIDSSGKLLLDLVNDTLELSRVESGKSVNEPEAASPQAVIPAVVTALRPSAEIKKIRLEVDETNYPKEALWCDRLKIQKIALNLLSNAIKYTPEGGEVRLSFENGKVGGVLKRLVFIVEDNGIGMSEEFMKRMYEPFSQEKRSEAAKVVGTGLGLSIVKKFVEILGGTIEADSVIHQGSRFRVSLPIAEIKEGQIKKAETAHDLASLKGKRILLCEDNALNSEITLMLLKEKGIFCDVAEDGRIGVERFKNSLPHYYDAVLMDMRMPHLDGIEATKAIRALERADAKSIPIIAMSADAFEESVQAAKEAGMNGYITKPVIPEKMFEELSRHLA